MNDRDLFLIGDIPGFTPQIGRLVSMMNYTRHTTLDAVAGMLSVMSSLAWLEKEVGSPP